MQKRISNAASYDIGASFSIFVSFLRHEHSHWIVTEQTNRNSKNKPIQIASIGISVDTVTRLSI